jgi:hypothetical protein
VAKDTAADAAVAKAGAAMSIQIIREDCRLISPLFRVAAVISD